MEMERVFSSASSIFIWKITKFSDLDAQLGSYSHIFPVGESQWALWIFPKGDGEEHQYDHLSLYLCPFDSTQTVDADFSLIVASQTDPNRRVRRVGKYKFLEESKNCFGWDDFMPLSEFHDPAKGYLVNDTCVITIDLTCTLMEPDPKSNSDGGSVEESIPDEGSVVNGRRIKKKK